MASPAACREYSSSQLLRPTPTSHVLGQQTRSMQIFSDGPTQPPSREHQRVEVPLPQALEQGCHADQVAGTAVVAARQESALQRRYERPAHH